VTGLNASLCLKMSRSQSSGIYANSTGWAKTLRFSIGKSPKTQWMIPRLDAAHDHRRQPLTMAAIGDISRFKSPQKLVSYFGLNLRVGQSGLGAAHHGRIRKIGRSHARAMLVEAVWAAAKAPGPLHAFFVRVSARRGHQVAAVAVLAN